MLKPARPFAALLLSAVALLAQSAPAPIRPPATPLVTHDPYFSVWSMSDQATGENTRHWTGSEQQLAGLVRIDGKPFRILGDNPHDIPALPQVDRTVTPTRTAYRFEGAGASIALTFLTPAIASDLDILSRPVTYVAWEARSLDAASHKIELYFDATSQLAVNYPEQRTTWSRIRMGNLETLRLGSIEQPVLAKAGDNLRIDWGWLYLAVPPQPGSQTAIVHQRLRPSWTKSGVLPETDLLDLPGQTSRFLPSLAASFDLGPVSAKPVSRYLLLAYDDLYSIQFFGRNLQPWWRRNGMDAAGLLHAAVHDYPALDERSRRFDDELTADLIRSGGPRYAALAVLAYRQTLAAHKLTADLDGTPMYFSKENFSNGCIDTVDVTYPSAPFFLLLNPALLKAQLLPVFEYASLPRWRFPFAPHDLGTYPLANGQVYGGGERTEENQMPVEESGNLLILSAALAKAEGNPSFAKKYWPLLTKWAAYLREKGLDPENQLSTDDFAGHLAHNTNLSLKAIVAIGSYAQLATALGKAEEARAFGQLARGMAAKWVSMAADGDHYRLAFDKPGTWSQKYNLVWDKLLGLHLFPPEVARTELAFYKTHQNEFGLPLDNRESYTKLDWIVWTATLADDSATFQALTDPLYRWLNQTPSRVPLTDWFGTRDGKQRGFQARSVVGGVYTKMLADEAVWQKWRSQAH